MVGLEKGKNAGEGNCVVEILKGCGCCYEIVITCNFVQLSSHKYTSNCHVVSLKLYICGNFVVRAKCDLPNTIVLGLSYPNIQIWNS